MPEKLLGYLYLTLAMLLVGSTVVASKIVAAGLPPFTATALRFAIALPFFLLLLRMTGARWPRPGRGDWGILLLQAIAGSVGYTTLLISGLRSAPAADAGIILGTLPVVAAVVAVLVLRERPDRALLATIGLAAAGVILLNWRTDGGGARNLTGSLLIFGAVVCEAVFILLNKRLRAPIPPLVLSTLMVAIGLAACLPPALAEMPWTLSVDSPAVMAVAYYALLPTVAGFLLWYAGAARVSGAEAALFTSLAPVAALLLAVMILGEPVGWQHLTGVAFVLAAVLVLALMQKRAG